MKAKILGLLAFALLVGPLQANAAYIYTFSSSLGGLTFSVDDLIAPVTESVATAGLLDFQAGSATSFLTGTRHFQFTDGVTDTGVSFDTLAYSFVNSLPQAEGTYSTEFVFRLLSSGVAAYSQGSLTIRAASVPEPGTLALLGLGLAGLGLSRRRKAH